MFICFIGDALLALLFLDFVGLNVLKLRLFFLDRASGEVKFELVLVMFGEFLFIIFPLLKWDCLVQNGRFSGQTLLQIGEIRNF